jgi:Domain of unknown function (DUF4336)
MQGARTLREVAPDLWVTEGPLRYFGVEMGRRMAVVRLDGAELLIHSPIQLTDALRDELDELGDVRFVVPASNLHGHLHMEQYSEAYPQATLFAVRGLRAKRSDLSFGGDLTETPPPAWARELDQATFGGHRRLTEIEFFHRKTRTLIAGDVCFNIGPHWPSSTKLLAWGPKMKPRVGPTTAFRHGIADDDAARRSIERILRWDFDRILPGHGEIIEHDAKACFREGFTWLLADGDADADAGQN